MIRVPLLAVVACLLAACSLGPKSLGFGFNGGIGSAPKPQGAGSIATAPQNKSRRSTQAKEPYRTASAAPTRSPGEHAHARLDATAALKMLNAYRRKKGLRALKLDPLLTKAAKAHSRDLSKWDRISHFGSDGSNPWDRVKRTGYKARLAAENVGTGQSTLAEVFKGWQKSPGHNKNLLLRDATHVGIALVQDPRTEFKTFWTMVLAAPL